MQVGTLGEQAAAHAVHFQVLVNGIFGINRVRLQEASQSFAPFVTLTMPYTLVECCFMFEFILLLVAHSISNNTTISACLFAQHGLCMSSFEF